MPVCLLELLQDLTVLQHSAGSSTSRALLEIEQALFRIAELERAEPFASEWYVVYQYAVDLVERAPKKKGGAYQRIVQFVRENADIALEHTLLARLR
jgi:hypothetical protein